jgi:hypothetical protein
MSGKLSDFDIYNGPVGWAESARPTITTYNTEQIVTAIVVIERREAMNIALSSPLSPEECVTRWEAAIDRAGVDSLLFGTKPYSP